MISIIHRHMCNLLAQFKLRIFTCPYPLITEQCVFQIRSHLALSNSNISVGNIS